jgi:hypothetical protein
MENVRAEKAKSAATRKRLAKSLICVVKLAGRNVQNTHLLREYGSVILVSVNTASLAREVREQIMRALTSVAIKARSVSITPVDMPNASPVSPRKARLREK